MLYDACCPSQAQHPDLAARRRVHWPGKMQQIYGQTASDQQRWIGRKVGLAATVVVDQLHASAQRCLRPAFACNRIRGFAQTTPLWATARTQRGHPHFQKSGKRQQYPQAQTPFDACDYLASLAGPNSKCVTTSSRSKQAECPIGHLCKAGKKVLLTHTQTPG